MAAMLPVHAAGLDGVETLDTGFIFFPHPRVTVQLCFAPRSRRRVCVAVLRVVTCVAENTRDVTNTARLPVGVAGPDLYNGRHRCLSVFLPSGAADACPGWGRARLPGQCFEPGKCKHSPL